MPGNMFQRINPFSNRKWRTVVLPRSGQAENVPENRPAEIKDTPPEQTADMPEGRQADTSAEKIGNMPEGRQADTPAEQNADMPKEGQADIQEEKPASPPAEKATITAEGRPATLAERAAVATPVKIDHSEWRRCNKCERGIRVQAVKDNFYICPECGNLFRVQAWQRIEMVIDEGTFEEWDAVMAPVNPLDFPGYEAKLTAAKEKTGLDEAVVTGRGKICGEDTAIVVCDCRFMMSSMGHNVGEKVTRAVERATKERLPVIIYAASGGARMQEGIVSLMQMAKTSAALKLHSDAGLLYVSVLTDPTTGGVIASFAMLGDIILAEPGALIGFAGPRVIEQTIHQKLPADFQKSEFQLQHGFVDEVVERPRQKEYLGRILKMHRPNQSWRDWTEENYARPLPSILTEQVAQRMAGRAEDAKVPKSRRAPFSGVMRQKTLNKISGRQMEAWDTVHQSRKLGRLTAGDYISALFENFTEFHGDRYFADDTAIIGGIATYAGIPVTVIGQERGKTSQESAQHNFGMPSPDGYRKALRLMKQAEKFERPVICFVDTPGAYPGMEAEERGQGEAIARNLYEMATLRVPVLSLIAGQGGSGGALALAVANEVWMMENATYSILSPEGFASILWKDANRASEAAKVMKMTAEDLYELGVIERIISEDEPASTENLSEIARIIDRHMREFFKSCAEKTPDEIVAQRQEKFRAF
ncbi:MAG: acetyl-CoA carboxylase carboxyltransferase subunit alpha [Lachnospiraceae bacterium]|nr:acetyl-CoA carboxylase carboxyltransferase subunit alpha [Lachnospiraceae bacterium]